VGVFPHVVRAAGGAENQEVLDLGSGVLAEHVAAGVVPHLIGAAGDRPGLRRRDRGDRGERVTGDVPLVSTRPSGRMWVIPGCVPGGCVSDHRVVSALPIELPGRFRVRDRTRTCNLSLLNGDNRYVFDPPGPALRIQLSP
jgi:hypothetical protein